MNNPIKIALVILYRYYKEPGTNPRGFAGNPRGGSLFVISLLLFFNACSLPLLIQHSFPGGIYSVLIFPLIAIILSLFFKEESMRMSLEDKYVKKAWIGLISYAVISFALFGWSVYNLNSH